MKQAGSCLLFVLALLPAGSAISAGRLVNLIEQATLAAGSQATARDGKYGVPRLADGDPGTHWASSNARLPQWIRVTWPRPVVLDTVRIDIFEREQSDLYAVWEEIEVVLSNGVRRSTKLEAKDAAQILLRFDGPQTVSSAELRILSVREPKVYVGINELGFYLDPERRMGLPKNMRKAKQAEGLAVEGRPRHPTVYVTPEGVERARRNAAQTEWGRAEKEAILAEAAKWLREDETYWLGFLPPPGASYAYGFAGCPICHASLGTWAGARCSWDLPGKVRCAKGHVLPDEEHPDPGTGFVARDKRVHYLLGGWHAWVTEQWTRRALPSLAHAYALTGEEVYAERAAFFLDALASIYPESTAGSWDYPSRPPSGRFARPWYQVARNLVVYVEAYDLIYSSPVLDTESLRPALEAARPDGPTPQQRGVGRKDARGQSRSGMTRRENIDLNLMRNGAQYCYEKTFEGRLHNGHADYMRGALAVGALLGIPEYVRNAVESPYSIYAMLANNCDRDGRYYETALGYALHARSLYLTFVEPLRHWRSREYPRGVDLFADPRMRSFYYLPDLVMRCAGHSPNFGDAAPDNRPRTPAARPFSALDYEYAERLYAGCEGKEKEAFRDVLGFLTNGDVAKARMASRIKRWLLYNADPTPALSAKLSADLRARVFGSWLLGQKGIGILRSGREADAQAVLLRFGPSLNHGDLDDLGLIYYARGWQMTYEIGYGLGSTHTQVGWASQTVSHALVTVNEASQRGGSGGSAYLFADLPSLELMAADSPLSYSSQGVTQYHRTVALVGAGKDQYLVDLFRVRGGKQHDYGVGVQSREVKIGGLTLGPEEEGSLAGRNPAWGERIGDDGDIDGFPNKPYWNPPPKNGYGFFYDARRGTAQAPFQVDFGFGEQKAARLRLHTLPEGQTEILLAKAPGLYPRHRKATYLIARRKSTGRETDLASAFATVMEPWAPAADSAESAGPRPILSLAARIPVAADGSDLTPIGVHVVRDGRDEYLFSAGLGPGERRARSAAGEVVWRGAALFMACRDGRLETLAGHGAWNVTIGGKRHGPDQGIYRGRIQAVDYEQRWVEVDATVPEDVAAACVYFSNPAYSRNTAYRIYGVKRTRTGTRIELGPQPMLLGQGRVHQITSDDSMDSDIPHDYQRSVVGGSNPRFLDGKRVTNGRGAETHLRTAVFGSPMQLEVESVDGFEEGDTLYYYDIQVGDAMTLPTAWEVSGP